VLRIHGLREAAFVVIAVAGATSVVGAQAPRIRDSAGVRIVENPSIKTAPLAFRLGSQPIVDLGTADPAHPEATFSTNDGYLAAVRLSDGRIAVSDNNRAGGGGFIKYFDATGSFLMSVRGRSAGQAPFVYISTLCRTRGDTVIVRDAQDYAFGVVDGMGRRVRSTSLAGAVQGNIAPQACFSDGSVLVSYEALPDSNELRPPAHYVAMHTDGTTAYDFGVMPGTKYGKIIREVSFTALGDTLFAADGLASEVRVYSATGRLARIFRTDDPPASVTPTDIANGTAISMAFPGVIPTTWPAYSHVLQDPTGRTWMQDDAHLRPRGWTVFDAGGRMIGRFLLPDPPAGEHWQVVSFGANEVQVRRYNVAGAAHLTFYPLVPAQ
jgi:hypothetical protein